MNGAKRAKRGEPHHDDIGKKAFGRNNLLGNRWKQGMIVDTQIYDRHLEHRIEFSDGQKFWFDGDNFSFECPQATDPLGIPFFPVLIHPARLSGSESQQPGELPVPVMARRWLLCRRFSVPGYHPRQTREQSTVCRVSSLETAAETSCSVAACSTVASGANVASGGAVTIAISKQARRPAKLPATPIVAKFKSKPLCNVPSCHSPATADHPVVKGMRVCNAHCERVRRVPELLKEGDPSVTCAHTDKRLGWRCQSHGCQLDFQRPCLVCGEGNPNDFASDGTARANLEEPSHLKNEGEVVVCEHEGEATSPCIRPGCTAYLHSRCRKLLASRVRVYWDGDQAWYWGNVNYDAAPAGRNTVLINYDDGLTQCEDLDDVEIKVQWLVNRSAGQVACADWRAICTCLYGVLCNKPSAQLLEEQMRACAVCCTLDQRIGSEPGDANEIIFCDACGVPVHLFCYGQPRHGPLFGRSAAKNMRFTCDHCTHVQGRGTPAVCCLCARGDGMMRQRSDGEWAHISCLKFNNAIEFGGGKRPSAAKRHNAERLCSRNSGCHTCLMDQWSFSNRSKSIQKTIKQKGWRCTAAGCHNPQLIDGLVLCGGQGEGCKNVVHISCAQRFNSGWHIKSLEADAESVVTEVLCASCTDCFIDCRNGTRTPIWRRTVVPQLSIVEKWVADNEYSAAAWTFMDWAHGPCGGFTRVGHRAGGACIGACDIDPEARAAYLATFDFRHAPLDNISKMGTGASVARPATIVYCGFCCKPFSTEGKRLGFKDETFGDNFSLMAQALQARLAAGIYDPCLICENVPNLLNFLSLDHLKKLGYYVKVFVVSGSHFRCANVRERLVLVGFRDKAAFDRFTPPPPQANKPAALRSVLKPYSTTTGLDLFLNATQFKLANEHSHVVGLGWPSGARSPTSSYGSLKTPGTLLCVSRAFETRETPLTVHEIKELNTGDLRKLHPDEILASFSFRPEERPRLVGTLQVQYTAVAQTICLNVFEAFTVEVLAAIGKPGPRDRLYASLEDPAVCRGTTSLGGSSSTSGSSSSSARHTGPPCWLEPRLSKLGVPFAKYMPLRGTDDDLLPEDSLSEYEKQNLASIEHNRSILVELGLRT